MDTQNFGALKPCRDCGGLFLAWSVFDLWCESCEDSRSLNRFQNDYYREAVRLDRFQPGMRTLENVEIYAKTQLYYQKRGDL